MAMVAIPINSFIFHKNLIFSVNCESDEFFEHFDVPT